MKNNAYWTRRANLRMEEYHKNSDSTIQKISAAYDKAIKDINEDINKIFYKYQLDSGLSTTEVRELLNAKIPKKELDSIRKRIYNIQDEELKIYMMAQLNAEAYKARITRLEALKESVYINIKLAADVEINQSTKLYTDNIKRAYYSNAFDIQKGLGVGFNIAEMPTETIQEILKNNWSGKHYSKRVWHNTDVLAKQLEEVITSGLMSGKSSRRMAQELQDLTDYGKFACERLIRTETTYITNAAEIESYKECGIDRYIFIATLDLRTSSTCREHDREVYEVEKAEAGVNLPPLHPHCRSTTRAYLGEKTLNDIKRRARDPETGKTYLVPGDMKYQDWYDKFVVDKYGKDKTEVFEKMIKNKESDRKQFNKFKETLGKDSPNTLKEFQELKYNNSNEWNLVKDYVKSRENNMISAFTPYSQYKEYKTIIDLDIVGLTTNNGIKITGQSKHFIERVFGTNEDPKTNRPRSGVEINDIKDALLNGSVRIRKSDPNSIKFITDKCMVSINPKTGLLIQTNP
ncbi:MAG: minor capsid protein [Clostridium sp.]|uniref:minor capsid protein n=1 Tax=Clostridium sp. TaxID=1506 RepID=UPI00290F5A51|nr:minor capsid protein [Clostridium sp.]MDU5211430.1 minor capsid protein [Clostridium sp.]MDU6763215.1 minor capsid protein [Clostridium sp.]